MRIRHAVLLVLVCAAGVSCRSRIELREAMNDVQRKYVILFDEIERGSNFEARDAARDLKLALAAPGVASTSPHAGDPEFQRLLGEATETAGRIEVEAESFNQERLTRLRGEVSRTCRTCHARFRAVE